MTCSGVSSVSNGRPIDKIDDKHMMAVLLHILENGQSNRTSIYNNISRNSNMPSKLDRMVDLGLLTSSASIHGVFMDLTYHGRYIAEHLVLIEKILDDIS